VVRNKSAGGRTKRGRGDSFNDHQNQDKRIEVANSNAILANSLGLGGGYGGGIGMGEEEAEEDLDDLTPFQIEVVPNNERIDDVRVFANPLVRAVFIKRADFDENSKDALVVIIPGFGLGSTIDRPHKETETDFTVCVRRTNQEDLVRQLNPKVDDDKVEGYAEKIHNAVTKSFGAHFDYKLLNRAFCAMSPVDESWTVFISVSPPFALGNFKDVICFHTKDAVDMVLCVPLRTQIPNPAEEIPISMNIFEAENDDAPEIGQ